MVINTYHVLKLLFVVPSEPQSLEIVSVYSNSVTLQWMPPETSSGVITHYSILYNGVNITNFGNNMLMFTIGGLSPDTVYVLQLRAHTGAGAGPSARLTFLTRRLTNNCNLYPTETVLQRHLQCDISDIRQHWVITTVPAS